MLNIQDILIRMVYNFIMMGMILSHKRQLMNLEKCHRIKKFSFLAMKYTYLLQMIAQVYTFLPLTGKIAQLVAEIDITTAIIATLTLIVTSSIIRGDCEN